MGAKSVQISLDEDLLAEVDAVRRARGEGRSAFIRRALRRYLAEDEQDAIARAYASAYAGRADEVFDEFGELLGGQEWPDE